MKNQKDKDRINTNYTLKSDAVETLANADKEAAPVYSKEELDKYRTKSKFHLSDTFKVLFLKAWFAGAVCYFILWGLGLYLNGLDLLVVLGVVLGMVTDLLTNNVIRFIEKTPGANDKWLLVTKKGTLGLFLNVGYNLVILACVFMLYNLINLTINSITGDANSVPLGVEPVLFGVFCMLFDLLFLFFKRLIRNIADRPRGK